MVASTARFTGAAAKVAAGLALALGALACTPAQYARQADRAAYGTVAQTEQFALGARTPFSATYRPIPLPATGPTTVPSIPASTGPATRPAAVRVLMLDEALAVAFRNGRTFQTRKEQLYSAALALANTRRGWDFPLFDGPLEGAAGRTVVNRGGETNAAALSAGPSLTQRLAAGTVFTLAAGLDIASDLLGIRSTTVGSTLSASVTQPLLRGALYGLAYEEQYRAERDFVFSVLDYDRFTQQFAVDVISRYYAVLQQRDRLENEQENIKRLEETLALTRTLVKGGVRSRIEEDQAEQNLLDAKVRFEQNLQDYEDALDRLKLFLGLPVATRLALDYPGALEALNRAGPRPIPVAEEAAFDVALHSRPDVLRAAAALRDAERNVQIAADAFLPALDVTLGISAASSPPRKFAAARFDRHTRAAAVTFDYNLDQTDHRDAYRNSMIARDRAQRDWAEFLDTLRLEIRNSYRTLVQSRRSYEIQLRNVEINKRRRALAVLQQKEGQASARDVLEAEESLRLAQNGVTSAMVQYTVTRLQFLTTLGLLGVDEKGTLHERPRPVRYDRIARRYPYALP